MKVASLGKELREAVGRIPRRCGVYLFKDGRGKVIYVGKAKDLKGRVGSYLRSTGDGRYHIQFLVPKIRGVDYIVTGNEQEALILENNLIKKYKPRYNVCLRDDKTYVNLRLNVKHPFPRLTVVRRPRRDGAVYFGPYASARAVRETLRTIGKVFPLRVCTDRELANRRRPCLYYHMKRCPAPCIDLVDPQEYRQTVNRVVMFLKGKGNKLLESLRVKMEREAAERRYEDAARTRDQIWAVKKTLQEQRITSPQRAERDVFGVHRSNRDVAISVLYVRGGGVSGGDSYLFRELALPIEILLASFLNQFYQRAGVIPEEVVVPCEPEEASALEALLRERRGAAAEIIVPKRGERKRLLELATDNARVTVEARGDDRERELVEDLRSLLELKRLPRKIECFDISNTGGKEAVGAMVTFLDGRPVKELYRRYRVKSVEQIDDYGMMREVLLRRIARGLSEGDLPDLLVVDGGKGHLNVAAGVLEEMGVEGVDVAAIAKGRERGGRGGGRDCLHVPGLDAPLEIEGNAPALRLLQLARDEAHRFAVHYHQKLRGKRMKTSLLDEVPGVGPALRARLLERFGSVDGLRRARVGEIASVQGISKALAARIKRHLG